MNVFTEIPDPTLALPVCALLISALASLTAVGYLLRRSSKPQSVRPGTYGQVRVQPSNITLHMEVPVLGGIENRGDFECGGIAGDLFDRAVSAGALIAPDGLRIACYPDRDIETGGFVLVAYPEADGCTFGVSTGYMNAATVGTFDRGAASEPNVVARALEVFADSLNTSLSGLESRLQLPAAQAQPGPSSQRASAPPRVAARPQASCPSGRHLQLATQNIQECPALILAQAAVAPEQEIPGLASALACILSLDELDAYQLVAQARRRTGSADHRPAAELTAERQRGAH